MDLQSMCREEWQKILKSWCSATGAWRYYIGGFYIESNCKKQTKNPMILFPRFQPALTVVEGYLKMDVLDRWMRPGGGMEI